jgi:hypothetical protein
VVLPLAKKTLEVEGQESTVSSWAFLDGLKPSYKPPTLLTLW